MTLINNGLHTQDLHKTFNCSKAYKELSKTDKAITLVATTIIALATFHILTDDCYAYLVKRFYLNTDAAILRGEEIEKIFWGQICGDESRINNFPAFIASDWTAEEISSIFVEGFLEIEGESQTLKGNDIPLLTHLVKKQIDYHRKTPRLKRSLFIDDTWSLNIYDTKGDGSCGFHALAAKEVGDKYAVKDIKRLRLNFCNWFKEGHKQGKLPESVETILDGFAAEFETNAPWVFRAGAQQAYKRMKKGESELTSDEKDKRRHDFIYDPDVVNAYAAYMKEVSQFILQDELQAVADYLGLNLFLFQKGWGDQADVVTCNRQDELDDPDFKLTDNDICVWYSGGHYERATLERSL